MISLGLARALDEAGVRWHPVDGDRFAIRESQLAGAVFTIADMTIETHDFDTGTILGFNGTTEWALDSVPLEKALWLPHEHQLRALLGGAFRSLERERSADGAERYVVRFDLPSGPTAVSAGDAADAYASALLALVEASAPSS